jgi:hypothetical protein
VSDKTAGRTLDSEGRRVSPSGLFGANLSDLAQTAGWPTPTKGNADGSQMAKGASTTGRRPDGSKATVSLNQVAQTAGWPTPMASTDRKSAKAMTRSTNNGRRSGGGNSSPPGLEQVAELSAGIIPKEMIAAGWPTPMAGTPAQNGNNAAGNNDSSRKTVELVSGWATPTTRDHKDGASTLDNTPINSLLGRQATLSPAPMESGDESPPTKRASLNPAFSLWLMGYPTEWAHCAARVTRSRRKSRQPS